MPTNSEVELHIEATSDGDARRCPHHPEVVTSSPDGLHDAPCGKCEAAMDADAEDELLGLFDSPANDMKGRG